MARRDQALLKLLLLLLVVLFSRHLVHPGLLPGNFGDIYSYHYPLRHLVASTLQEGRLPLWNPYIFAGAPLAANPQALLFYPASPLHYFLPLAWSFSLDAFFHLAFAGLGAFLFLRRARLDSGGAFVLATAYCLSPFLVYRMAQGVPTHLSALAWAPWTWLAFFSGAPLLLGGTLALQVLSGHPQFALINAIGLGLWALARRPSALPRLFAAGFLALFLAAVQALPTLEYLRHSVRAHWNAALSLGYSLRPAYLLTLTWPDALGNPFQPGFQLMPSEFFEMLALYLGLIPLALALAGLFRAPGRAGAALWALAAAGVFFALGENNPLYLFLQQRVGLDFLRVPARFSFLILWGLWLAAARGWTLLPDRPRLKAALALLAVLDLGFWGARWIYAEDPGRFLAPQPEVAALLRQGPRLATSPDVLAPNKTMLYRVRNVTGYEAFYPAAIALYTYRSEGTAAADGSRTYVRKWDTPEMSRLGVRWYVSPEPVPGRTPDATAGTTRLYRNPDAGPLVLGADSWREAAPERWEIHLDRPRAVIVSQTGYPGWKAWAHGERLAQGLAQGLLPVISPPTASPPPWTIHFRFLPGSWLLGLAMTLVSGLMVAALLGRTLLAPRTARTPYEYPHC